MTREPRLRYTRSVLGPRLAGVARTVALLVTLGVATAAAAAAETTTLDGTQAPLIRIDNATGNVTVRTWDRPAVQVESDPATVQITHTAGMSVAVDSVPILAGRVAGPRGIVVLPEESFAVSTLGPQPRDVVTIEGRDTGPITVTIPNATALLVVQTTHGIVAIHRFTGGTFVVRVQQGRVRLDRDGGAGFVQVMRGPVLANDSDFDRLRTRTALGNSVFERCRVRQIETTSVSGSIVFDRGTFDQGLARFQSETGSVAIGVDAPAQLGGRGDHVFTSFDRRVAYPVRSEANASAVVDGGGPEVSAASASGNVYLYDGTLRDRPNLGAEWSRVNEIIRRVPQFNVPHGPAPPRPGAARAGMPRFPAGRFRR